MNALAIVHRELQIRCPRLHARRLDSLMTAVEAWVRGQTLSVTALGRHSPRPTRPKHAIKQADRLVGNPHLFDEREALYRVFAHQLLAHHPRPRVLVDWSDCPDNRAYALLRASVPVGGRSLTLYEQVHPMTHYANRRVQQDFLHRLQRLLPAQCRPIVITDAGFLVPWFRAVAALGWDYVGRIRPSMMYAPHPQAPWHRCATLHATARAHDHGRVFVAKSNPHPGHLYTYRQRRQGRRQLTRFGQRATSEHARKYTARARHPWILLSSLGPDVSGAQVVALYRTRMQIEEAFRDLKSVRTGFALRLTRCRCPRRMSNLLLIALIATWVSW